MKQMTIQKSNLENMTLQPSDLLMFDLLMFAAVVTCLIKFASYYLKYFIILVDTLHKSNSDILTYSHDFVSSLLCTPPTNSYSNRLCENCREGKLINSVTKNLKKSIGFNEKRDLGLLDRIHHRWLKSMEH